MIASVRGTVLATSGSSVVVEVGGVGLRVAVTPDTALSLRVGSEASLQTALIVREDELALYGFADDEERELFDLLRGVSGVGPKSAMGVLGGLRPAEIAAAVANEDDAAFRKVSGIGPKTAKLIVVSLAGKLTAVRMQSAPASRVPTRVGDSVIAALAGLGWSEKIAAQAVDDAVAAASDDEKSNVQALLRIALANLGPSQLSSMGGRS
ncbi:Holliday junction branch migration protein RuvA [Cryobacterium sp. BB736]|uniref:Holliday junction branch migration protein RuvA n=1 Tax=Cryobacterium sp. BB736 TaxID=2746963 RepID=UPI00187463D0|nr:Holliday junction branch migration protein RuvA [Cryobacterium sp. BB736]